MSLEQLLPPLLRPVSPDDGAGEQAFAQHSAQLTRQLGLLTAGLMVCFTVVWWPLDPWVLPGPDVVEGFTRLRVRAVAVELVALLALAVVRPTPRAVVIAATTPYAALCAAFGYSLGEMQLQDLGWLGDSYLAIVPAAFIPMPLRWRVPATAVITVSLVGSYFVPFPNNLAHPGAIGQISFAAFAFVFSVVVGEFWTRVMRRGFFERQALDRANAELERITATLAAQVAERTSELTDLARHLDHAQESERTRLARDLHDELGQHLTAMRYTIARMEDRATTNPAAAALMVEDLAALLAGTTDAVRSVVASLRPRIVTDLGVAAAAEWLVDQLNQNTAVATTLTLTDDMVALADRLDDETALVLFRLLQEGSTNAVKHAQAAHMTLGLRREGDVVEAFVHDDGRGLEQPSGRTGFGLLGLRERARDLGGALTIDSAPALGTRLALRVPIRLRAAHDPGNPPSPTGQT